jgi:hypothetical protein
MIEDWVVQIDQRPRDTAKARMSSYGNQKNFQSLMRD